MNSCINIWGIKKKDKYIIDINKIQGYVYYERWIF